MTTGGIEGEHHDPGLDRLLPSIGPLTPVTLTEVKPSSGTATVADPGAVDYLDLDALIDVAGLRPSKAPPPHRCIADFAEPRVADPTIFQGNRPLSILEQLASDIIPTFDENEELRSLAGSIIADEIERHRQLAARIHSGIVP